MKTKKSFLLLICVIFFLAATQGFAADQKPWLKLQTKNFTIIGNANENELKNIGLKIEQFREAIKILVPELSGVSPFETTIIVFDDKNSFQQFKPLSSDGKVTNWVAGYFQAGFDKNYIVFPNGGDTENVYRTIFHEYTHYLIDHNLGRNSVPVWFNEGSAEYYGQFKISGGRNVSFGSRTEANISTLKKNKIIPLNDFFRVDYNELKNRNNEFASLFYAQSWILMHYFLHFENGGRRKNLNDFIRLLQKKGDLHEAFKNVFGINFGEMEFILTNYIGIGNFADTNASLPKKIIAEPLASAEILPPNEVEANLGDLLYQRERFDEAEKYLQKSLLANPDSRLANSTYGLIKMRQNKVAEARKHLKIAVKSNRPNYLDFFRYAYVLSRGNDFSNTYITKYSDADTDEMRLNLQKSIAINPDFAESFYLLSFISLVRNEFLDEAISNIRKALELSPKNLIYQLNLAELLLRNKKFDAAKNVAENLTENTDQPLITQRAKGILETLAQIETSLESARKLNLPNIYSEEKRPENLRNITEEELEINRRKNENDKINEVLRHPKPDQVRIVGEISDTTCQNNKVIFTVKSAGQTSKFQNSGFDEISLLSYTTEMGGEFLSCDLKDKQIPAVLIYKPLETTNGNILGNLISIEFVPNNFVLTTNK